MGKWAKGWWGWIMQNLGSLDDAGTTVRLHAGAWHLVHLAALMGWGCCRAGGIAARMWQWFRKERIAAWTRASRGAGEGGRVSNEGKMRKDFLTDWMWRWEARVCFDYSVCFARELARSHLQVKLVWGCGAISSSTLGILSLRYILRQHVLWNIPVGTFPVPALWKNTKRSVWIFYMLKYSKHNRGLS